MKTLATLLTAATLTASLAALLPLGRGEAADAKVIDPCGSSTWTT
jgi:hypothetical protein